MNEACIWQYIFLGEVREEGEGGGGGGGKWLWHNIRRGGCLMMMFDYKGGRGGDQESGKKWLLKIFWFYVISLLSFT